MRKPSITIDCILADASHAESPRQCDAEGCTGAGVYPAPKSPSQSPSQSPGQSPSHPREYLWFCLDHVRAYNRQWNYFANMDTAAIHNCIDAATTWDRPSWPFGVGARHYTFHDTFDALNMAGGFCHSDTHTPPHPPLPDEVTAALNTLAMPVRADWRECWEAIHTQYKTLAKKHHPDSHANGTANGNGDQAGDEEKLKHITQAFAVLQKHRNASP